MKSDSEEPADPGDEFFFAGRNLGDGVSLII